MAENFVIEKFAVRMMGRAIAALLVIALAVYPVDWAVWRLRVAGGGGMGTVSVDRFTVGELKGGKEDYYLDGTSVVACSKSLYPQGGNGACWWVERHHEIVERY